MVLIGKSSSPLIYSCPVSQILLGILSLKLAFHHIPRSQGFSKYDTQNQLLASEYQRISIIDPQTNCFSIFSHELIQWRVISLSVILNILLALDPNALFMMCPWYTFILAVVNSAFSILILIGTSFDFPTVSMYKNPPPFNLTHTYTMAIIMSLLASAASIVSILS